MENPVKVIKVVLGHFGIGKGEAKESPKPIIKAGIEKKSNVMKHNEALKEVLDMPKGKK